MKHVPRSAAVGFVAGLLVLTTLTWANPTPAQVEPRLDHFKCYTALGRSPDALIGLRDQFDATARDARVRRPSLFCNPVEKTARSVTGAPEVTPIDDPDAHLTLYTLVTRPVPTGGVIVSNQFGEDVLSLTGQGMMLGVPTQKLPHESPENLDHFKCYGVEGDAVGQRVELADQFTRERVRVMEPFLFCNPTLKRHAGQITEVENPEAHLTCYRIDAGPFPTTLEVRNQFGSERLRTERAHSLCVPTEKQGFDIIFED